MCDCHSYNADTGSTPEVILELPDHLNGTRHNHRVCIDACIAHVLSHLWRASVVTGGSCCGHNRDKPSLVLGNNATPETVEIVRQLIAEVDDREWKLLSWQLVDMNRDH